MAVIATQSKYSCYFPPATAKALVFDCDGTLVDTMPNHFVAWMATSAEFGFHFDDQLFLAGAGRSEIDQMVDICCDQGLEPIDFEAAVQFKMKRFEAECDACPPKAIKPVHAIVIEGHRRELPMAVVSGSARADVLRALKGAGLEEYFSVILGREDYLKGKPDPEPFLSASALLGVEPSCCVGYEDARQAGMASIEAAGYFRAEMVRDYTDYPLF